MDTGNENFGATDLAVLIIAIVNQMNNQQVRGRLFAQYEEFDLLIGRALRCREFSREANAKLMIAHSMLMLNRPEMAKLAAREAIAELYKVGD